MLYKLNLKIKNIVAIQIWFSMYIPRPFPPSEGGDLFLAVVTIAPWDFLHLKPRPVQEDTGAISLLVAFYDTQGLQWVYSLFSPFQGVHPTPQVTNLFNIFLSREDASRCFFFLFLFHLEKCSVLSWTVRSSIIGIYGEPIIRNALSL